MSIHEAEQAIKDYGTEQGRAWKAGQDWLLSYEEWYALWEQSGLVQHRGPGIKHHRLSRLDHYGAWELGNVEVVAPEEYRERTLREKQKPHNYPDSRILTPAEWVAELKAQA